MFMSSTRPSEELYDIRKDPFCLNNLAGNPVDNPVLKKMRNEMNNWLKQYDLAVYPESDDEINYAKQMMENQYNQWMSRIGLSADISDEDFLKWWHIKLKL
jgi:hypothetical protein